MDIRKANTLDEALNTYFNREQLDNNDYICEACKKRVPATKQFTLERPPKVLCVQLKRFSVLGGKISKHIGFKQTIDMGSYLCRESGEPPKRLTYKLTSMVTHMGPSVNCGHYTAVAQISSGQYYSFDDSCVRPISLNNVLSTNAYIMIFEMENYIHNQQSAKLNGTAFTKHVSTLPTSINFINKCPTTKVSASSGCSANGSLNSNDSSDKKLIGSELPAQRNVELHLPIQKCPDIVNTHLSQKMQEKFQPRLVMHIKNGKVLNGNSLVPYDGSSEEEDNCSFGTGILKNQTSNAVSRINATNNTNGSIVKDVSKTICNSKELQKNNTKTNANGISSTSQMATLQCMKTQNGSSSNCRVSLLKHQNGKTETNSQSEYDKDIWHQSIKIKNTQEEKISTKATNNSVKGWQVSKDTPSPTSSATPNGWSVTDNRYIFLHTDYMDVNIPFFSVLKLV